MKRLTLLLFALIAATGLGETLPEAINNYPTNNGALGLSAIISPTAIGAGPIADYNPTGLAGAGTLRLSSSAASTVTGLAAQKDGAVKLVHNIGANNITLKKDDGSSSTAANRFALTADVVLAPNAVAVLQYDGTTARWRAVSGGGGAGTVPTGTGYYHITGGVADSAATAVTDVQLSVSDVINNNVSSTAHGFAPKSPADTTRYLRGDASPAWAAITDDNISFSDITTNNATNTKHGFVPKTPADATKFLNGGTGASFTSVDFSYLTGTATNAQLPSPIIKRIQPRVTTISSGFANPTINTDNCDAVTITGINTTITSMTTNLSGTPNNFDKLMIRFKDNGTGRPITWGASYVSSQATLPSTTVANKVTTVGLVWDSVQSLWVCIAVDQQP